MTPGGGRAAGPFSKACISAGDRDMLEIKENGETVSRDSVKA